MDVRILRSILSFWKYCFLLCALMCLVTSAQARNFNLVNNCQFPVWFGFLGGSNTPQPPDGNYQLTPGGRSSVTIPSAWSGVIAGRTGCTGSGCETADCGGGTGACKRGFNQPATQAEFTVSANGTDFYDVEVINGYNLAVSITPSRTSTASNPYFCGSPGAVNPSPGLGACSWKFQPPLAEYNWVANGGKACTSSGECDSGTICGLSFDPVLNGFRKTCGRQLGYWTANQVCGVQRSFGAPFNCSEGIPQGGILWNLMACNGNTGAQNSCYTPGAQASCCGCVNWDQIGLPVPPGPTTQQCVNFNPTWVSRVRPTLEWIKRACPTAYTYPYDDHSSTFTCRSESGTNNVDYTITFCPNGSAPPPADKCTAPSNIRSSYTADKRQITLNWDPATSTSVTGYEVHDWVNRLMWQGKAVTFTDKTLPGTKGTFVYYVYSKCTTGLSSGVRVNVTIP